MGCSSSVATGRPRRSISRISSRDRVKAGGHVIAAIQARIVGQAFPADGGAWFFDVGADHQQHLVTDLKGQFLQVAGVFHGRFRVVDRAWADDHQQAGIFAIEDGAHGLAMGVDLLSEERAEGQLVLELKGAGQAQGQRFIGAGQGGRRAERRRRSSSSRLPGQAAGYSRALWPYWGVRQLAVLATCVGLPPIGDRSEAAGCPERSLLNRHAVQVS